MVRFFPNFFAHTHSTHHKNKSISYFSKEKKKPIQRCSHFDRILLFKVLHNTINYSLHMQHEIHILQFFFSHFIFLIESNSQLFLISLSLPVLYLQVRASEKHVLFFFCDVWLSDATTTYFAAPIRRGNGKDFTLQNNVHLSLPLLR